jgi:biotin carboxylase
VAPRLIVFGSGQIEYREFMLQRIARRYDIVLLSPGPITWEASYIADHATFDPDDVESARAAASRVATRHAAAGVLTYFEPFVELAAEIAENLGLGYCDPVNLARCRDKRATRETLALAGVPSARSVMVRSLTEAERAAADIGYPVVLKPRALAASCGVILVGRAEDLAGSFELTRTTVLPPLRDYLGDVLVEEYLDGPEISVDSAVFHGRVLPLIFASKELGFPPCFEETGHVVAPADVVVADVDRIRDILQAAHEALGIDNLVTHSELRLTADGPRVVEVNARSGGDMIPYLGWLATGADVALASADVATGTAPETGAEAAPGRGVAGVRFLYPPADGRVAELGMEPGFAPPWLDRVAWLAAPGAELHLPPRGFYHHARAGLAMVTADTIEQCRARLDEAERRAVVTMAAGPP